MRRVWTWVGVVAMAATAFGQAGGDRLTPEALQNFAVPQHRAEPHDRAGCPTSPSIRRTQHLVRGGQRRQPVEDREPRQHLDADLRNLRLVFARRGRRRSEELRTSSGSARARTTTSAASAMATASTSRPMPARRGRGWGSRTPSTSRTSSSIRATRTWSTSAPSVRCGTPAATAGSTRRPTAARRGRRC